MAELLPVYSMLRSERRGYDSPIGHADNGPDALGILREYFARKRQVELMDILRAYFVPETDEPRPSQLELMDNLQAYFAAETGEPQPSQVEDDTEAFWPIHHKNPA